MFIPTDSLVAPTFLYYILKNPELLNTLNSYSKVAGYKINLQKSLALIYTNNKHIEKDYIKTIPFTIASKKANN
jgi:hypothetical protein